MKWLVPKIGEAGSLAAARLRAEGHEVIELQVGRIEKLDCKIPLCEWVIVTSRYAVEAVVRAGAAFRVAAIGEKTADAVKAAGVAVDFVPSKADSPTFVKEFSEVVKPTDRVVHLKAANAADSVSELAAYCRYTDRNSYINLAVQLDPIDLSQFDAVYFTCSSSVERVLAVAIGTTACYAIGPTTQATLDRLMKAAS